MLQQLNKKYRVALIGLGQIANRYDEDPKRTGIVTHASAYFNHPQCELIAGCDPDFIQRNLFLKKWKNVRVYSDHETLFKNEHLDIVSICTPASTHLNILEDCLSEPLQGVLCEKPLGTDLKKAKTLQKKINKNSSIILLNFSRRFDWMHQAIAKDLKLNRWGKLSHLNIYYSGSLLNTGSHIIDELRMFFGEIKWVQALPPYSTQMKNESCNALIGFSHHQFASLYTLNTQDYLIYEFDFYFSKARLRIIDNGFKTLFWKKSPSFQFSGYSALTSSKSPYPLGYKNVLENAVQNLIHSIEKKSKPICRYQDGLKAMQVEKSLLKSKHLKGKKIQIHYEN